MSRPSNPISQFGIDDNRTILDQIWAQTWSIDASVLEMVASYGMPVGKETFQTVLWIGRFFEALRQNYRSEPQMLYRKQIVTNLCGSVRAKDSNVRQALIDRYGDKKRAVGSKKQPGPLYGVSKDVWSALAVAETWRDINLACSVLEANVRNEAIE